MFESEEFPRPILARFDQEDASSDGGLVLLKALDERLGVTAAVASRLRDERQPGKVQHELLDLVRQRVFGIAGGYRDPNDAARLGHDPIFKLLIGRDPVIGAPLGSQPTVSRLENAMGRVELFQLGVALADLVIGEQCHRRRGKADRITIDLDPAEDPTPTHGQQEFSSCRSSTATTTAGAAGHPDLRRRAGAAPGGGAASTRDGGQAGGDRPAAPPAGPAAGGLPAARLRVRGCRAGPVAWVVGYRRLSLAVREAGDGWSPGGSASR